MAELLYPEPPGERRRGFLKKFLSVVIGGLMVLIPAIAGLWAFLNPVIAGRKRDRTSGDGFIKVASLEAIPRDGTPVKFPVIAGKTDAWTRFPKAPIGAIYLRWISDQKSFQSGVEVGKQLVAHNSICPHLGCFVNFRSDKNDYFCPCHNSNFGLDGGMIEGASPRSMDHLKLKVRNDTEIWGEFRNFKAGEKERIPIT